MSSERISVSKSFVARLRERVTSLYDALRPANPSLSPAAGDSQETLGDKFFGLLTALGIRGSSSAVSVATIADLRLLDTSNLANGTVIHVAGYYSAGDGGGGSFRIDTTDTASADDGGSVIATTSGARAKALFVDDEVNIKRFGAKADFDISTWSGTNNTAAIQSAINYAEASTVRKSVIVPVGYYGVDSIRLARASMRGQHGANSAFNSPGSCFCHVSGATGDMILMDRPDYGPEQTFGNLRDLNLIGSRERNRKNPRPITAVSSRTVFSVAPSHVPQATDNTLSWPFFGYCFFFSSEGQFLGHGVVQQVNAGTGQITLAAGWDNYATRTSAAGLLTTAEQVVFSPATDSSIPNIPAGRPDASAAGYSGVTLLGTGFRRLQNVGIRGFHTGVRLGASLVVEFDNVWSNQNSFAGFASLLAGYGADDFGKRVFAQGQYSPDIGRTYTISLADSAYQKTPVGFYAPRARSVYTDLSVDECVHAIISNLGYQIKIDTLLCDKPVKEALVDFGGQSQGTVFSIDTLQIATPHFTLPTNITYTSGLRTCILLAGGSARSMDIRVIDMIRFPGATSAGDYTNLFRILSPNELSVIAIRSTNGFSNLSSTGVWPRIGEGADRNTSLAVKKYGFVRESSSDVAFGSDGSAALRIKTASPGANPTVGLGNINSYPHREGVDIFKSFLNGGLNQSDRSTRTDLAVHEFFLTGTPFDLSQSSVVGLGVVCASGLNYVNIGGGVSDKQGATEVRVHAGTAGAANPPEQARFDTTTSATLLPLRVNHNGTLKRLELGAADSGGTGYRMVRILN